MITFEMLLHCRGIFLDVDNLGPVDLKLSTESDLRRCRLFFGKTPPLRIKFTVQVENNIRLLSKNIFRERKKS